MAYVKTSWKSGDTVTATKLNKIEQGIYDTDAAVAEVAGDVSDIQAAMVEVDDTLSTTGKAADAKATGDAIASQAEAIENYIINRPIAFTLGGLDTRGGTSTATNRVRTGGMGNQSNAKVVVTCDSSVEYRIAVYSVRDGTTATFIKYLNSAFTSEPTVISEGVGFKILARYVADPSGTISDAGAFGNLITVQFIYPNKTKTLSGRTFSLLGDSISAFTGDVPSGYDVYYTGSNSNVEFSSQMWYNVLARKTGLTPLVINAYSGSAITQLEDSSHVSKIPMSSDERCSGLNDGTVNPDIIIIAGGLNDYTYAQSAQSEPLEWDGKTAPVLSNSFTEAYACMIKKLQTNYPKAIIVALTTFFSMRGTDNGYTLTHTVGNNTYTQADYNAAIKSVCDIMDVPYIDISKIGFNRSNYYPNFAQDSETVPTHPSKFGHSAIGQYLALHLPDIVIPLIEGFATRS